MRLPIWKKSAVRGIRIGEPLPALVSINTASRDELIAVKGIGEALADAIIEGRPWESVDNLVAIDGIGPKSLEVLKEQVGL